MKKAISAIAIAVVLALSAGCRMKMTGGGSRSIVAGATTRSAAYGIRAGQKLGFIILSDISDSGTETSGGSTWSGFIKPANGPTVHYRGSLDGIVINRTEYKFADGRVFLVSAKGGAIEVSQLKVSISDMRYDAEIDRIVRLKEVSEFLTK